MQHPLAVVLRLTRALHAASGLLLVPVPICSISAAASVLQLVKPNQASQRMNGITQVNTRAPAIHALAVMRSSWLFTNTLCSGRSPAGMVGTIWLQPAHSSSGCNANCQQHCKDHHL